MNVVGSNPTLVVIKWVARNGRRTCPKPCLKGRKRAGAPERRGGLLEWRNWQRKRFVPARVWDRTPPPAPEGDHAGRPGAYLNRGFDSATGGFDSIWCWGNRIRRLYFICMIKRVVVVLVRAIKERKRKLWLNTLSEKRR